jgi:hypothetical protein
MVILIWAEWAVINTVRFSKYKKGPLHLWRGPFFVFCNDCKKLIIYLNNQYNACLHLHQNLNYTGVYND